MNVLILRRNKMFDLTTEAILRLIVSTTRTDAKQNQTLHFLSHHHRLPSFVTLSAHRRGLRAALSFLHSPSNPKRWKNPYFYKNSIQPIFFMIFTSLLLLLAVPAFGQDIQYTSAHNVTPITGTWSSGSMNVITGSVSWMSIITYFTN